MTRLIIVLAAMVFLTHCTEGRPPALSDGTGSKDAGTSAVAQSADKEDAVARDTTSAQKAYVDPATGKLVPRPPQKAATERNSVRSSTLDSTDDALEVKPSPVKNGGIMIDLKGRFQNPIKATADDQGGSKIEHPAENRTE